MSTPLYHGRFTSKKGAVVKYELTITHPDVSDFGTDALFAWKLLSDWISPPGEEDDPAKLAKKWIKKLELSKVSNAKIGKKGQGPGGAWIRVDRTGRKDPVMTYTITVADKKLLEQIDVGDSDDVYQYVGEETRKAEAPKVEARGGAKTFDDFRNATLALCAQYPDSWGDWVTDYILQWARGASDDAVRGWLASLVRPGIAAKASGLVAVLRAREGKTDSAKEFLAGAVKLLKQTDEYQRFTAFEGLVPAWWRLGRDSEAAEGWKTLSALEEGRSLDNPKVHMLVSVAALGGKWERAEELAPKALGDSDYMADTLVPALQVSATERPALYKVLMDKWSEHSSGHPMGAEKLVRSLLDAALEKNAPGEYVDRALAHPKVLSDVDAVRFALVEAARRLPAEAPKIAERVLTSDDFSYAQGVAAAVIVAYAPERAAACAKKATEPEALAVFGKKAAEDREVGRVTADAAKAIAVLKKAAVVKGRDLDDAALAALVDLGERVWVDKTLEKHLAKLEKMKPKDRDLPCRYFARVCGMVGRVDLGTKAWKLPTASVRYCTARSLVSGCARVHDWAGALAGLELQPNDDSNGRVSSALQDGLRTAHEAEIGGPHAIPLRALTEAYAKALAARGNREAVERAIALAGPRYLQEAPNAVQVVLDGVLGAKRQRA